MNNSVVVAKDLQNMDESVELDEIDLQYLEATRGPRLKSCKLHQLDREEELSPILWAELLKQDKLALREWIESQTVDLAAPLHELLRRHVIKKKNSLSLLVGYQARLRDVMAQMAQMKENYADNPTLMEGVTIDTRTMSKGEVKQSKKKGNEFTTSSGCSEYSREEALGTAAQSPWRYTFGCLWLHLGGHSLQKHPYCISAHQTYLEDPFPCVSSYDGDKAICTTGL